MHGSSDRYVNGQIKTGQDGDTLTHFYKTGVARAKGVSIDGVMQGEWRFYGQDGQLIQIGHLLDNEKHGLWVRFDADGNETYREEFAHGKRVPKAK